MKRAEFQQRQNRILARLEQIFEEDQRVIQPRSAKPVEVSIEHLQAYGKRFEERKALHEELRALASEDIED